MNYVALQDTERRRLIKPLEFRLINSGYRNCDMHTVRKGRLLLDKWRNNKEEVE